MAAAAVANALDTRKPEQHPHRAVDVDPFTDKGEGQAADGGVDDGQGEVKAPEGVFRGLSPGPA